VSFAFTEVQEELRSSAARFCDDKSSSETVRTLMETEDGFDEAVWTQVAELGWTGMAIPEEFGGIGFGFVELSILMEEMGKRLVCAPFFSSVVLGANAILNAGSDAQRKEHLPGIADGSTRATLAFVESSGSWEPTASEVTATEKGGSWLLDGTKHYVIDGHTATLLVVTASTSDGVALFVVDPSSSGVERTRLETLDMTRKQANITFSSAPATLLGSAPEGQAALSTTLDQAAAMLAAEMVGGAQWCLDTSAQFAKDRFQFGRPIGSFQAIKHKCANMLMDVEMARSTAYYASWSAATADEEFPVYACAAKSYCSDAFFKAAAETIQIHGGIGFTWEHDAHLYFRRAKSSEIYLGDASYHRELLAQRLGV